MALFDDILSATELGQPIKYFIPTTILSAILFYWVQNNVCLYLDNLPYTMLIAECYVMAFAKVGWLYLCIISHFSQVKRRKLNLENKNGSDTINKIIFKQILTIISFVDIPIGFIAFIFIRIYSCLSDSKQIVLIFCGFYLAFFSFDNYLTKIMERCSRKRKYKLIMRKRNM